MPALIILLDQIEIHRLATVEHSWRKLPYRASPAEYAHATMQSVWMVPRLAGREAHDASIPQTSTAQWVLSILQDI